MRSRPLCSLLLSRGACALVLLGAAPAFAQQPPPPAAPPPAAPAAQPPPAAPDPQVEEARDAFRIGSALAKQAQWLDALAAFERSARLRPHAVTTYNIGFCERALGRFTRAKKSFLQALDAPGQLPAELAGEARGYLAEIEHRLARAVISLSRTGLAVAVDGRPLEASGGTPAHPELVAGTREPGPPEAVKSPSFYLLLDPGTHVIVVSAPGVPDAITTREFAPGSSLTLTLSTRGDKPGTSARRVGAAVALSVGGVSAVAGGVFGGLALQNKHDLDKVCMVKSDCPMSAKSTLNAMNTFATASTIGVIVASAGVAMGTVLLIVDSTQKPAPPQTGVTVTPWIGLGAAGLRGSF